VRYGWRAEGLRRAGRELVVCGRVGRDGEAQDGEEEPASAPAAQGELSEERADAVVVALPHARAGRLLAPLLPHSAARLARMASSPIVNLHVVYDRRVLERKFAAGVGTPVQYLFDRSASAGAPAGCQYLAVSLSGAEREMQMSVAALRERFEPALRELLPAARAAKLESFLVTREHAATFRAAPGVEALRLGAETAVPGLALAGSWTATGWPATLESAVLSGHLAARAALAGDGARA
jgi:protoporphyrinogen oxidase